MPYRTNTRKSTKDRKPTRNKKDEGEDLEKTGARVALRIKLRLGLKLCKLPGPFWASVNKVNYSVNYNFLVGHV